jgi:hypothetical protein
MNGRTNGTHCPAFRVSDASSTTPCRATSDPRRFICHAVFAAPACPDTMHAGDPVSFSVGDTTHSTGFRSEAHAVRTASEIREPGRSGPVQSGTPFSRNCVREITSRDL